MVLRVGRAGLPDKARGTLGACEVLKERGLDAMEIEFVHSIYMGDAVAKKLGAEAKKYGVLLTIHGPFYINLNSKNPETIEKSRRRILRTAELGSLMGAKSITFHPGYRHGLDDEEAYPLFRDQVKLIMDAAPKGVRISPECTGKESQFGSWDELLRMHKEIGCGVVFDFSHIWARELGKVDFNEVLDKIKRDYRWWKDMHIHLSGIRFGQKGERNHLSFEDTDFPWKEVLRLLVKKGFGGVIQCENPNPGKGALEIKGFIRGLK